MIILATLVTGAQPYCFATISNKIQQSWNSCFVSREIMLHTNYDDNWGADTFTPVELGWACNSNFDSVRNINSETYPGTPMELQTRIHLAYTGLSRLHPEGWGTHPYRCTGSLILEPCFCHLLLTSLKLVLCHMAVVLNSKCECFRTDQNLWLG